MKAYVIDGRTEVMASSHQEAADRAAAMGLGYRVNVTDPDSMEMRTLSGGSGARETPPLKMTDEPETLTLT